MRDFTGPRAARWGSHARAAAWKTYGWWAMWVSVAFFVVYPTCNWITALRDPSSLWQLYSAWELRVPLVPQFVWVYFSMYVLFFAPPFFLDAPDLRRLGRRLIAGTLIGGAIFLLFPSRLGFVRAVPDDPLYAPVFSGIFAIDKPYNNAPSLHVVFSVLIACAIARARPRARWLAYGWAALICLSTWLVHQHHLADIVSGLLLALLLQYAWEP